MNLVKKKISDLIRPDFNPRIDVRSDKDFYSKLEQSLDEFGYVSPVIWNKRTNHIVGGNQRLAVLEDKGIDEIDVVEVDMSLNKEKSLNVALNKIGGDWDEEKLALLFNELKEDDLDLLTGFDEDEIDQIMIDAGLIELDEEKTDVNDLIERESKYDVQYGDLYELGDHVLLCGDCTEQTDLKRVLGDKTIDVLLTDPPYNVNYSSKNELLNKYDKGNRIQTPIVYDYMNPDDYVDFTKIWMNNCLDFMSKYNSIYIFGNFDSLVNHYSNKRIKISNVLVWKKNNIVLGRMDYKCQNEFILYGWRNRHKWYGPTNASSIFEVDKPLSNKIHPTMKPVKLLKILIFNSTKPNHIVFDPFGGSGSTLIACEQNKRCCYMMEIDPHYCSVIIERWETYTDKKHKKIN